MDVHQLTINNQYDHHHHCHRLHPFILLLVHLLQLLGDVVDLHVHYQVGLVVHHHLNDVHHHRSASIIIHHPSSVIFARQPSPSSIFINHPSSSIIVMATT